MKSVHILILNYNAVELLGDTLPTVALAAAQSKHPCKVSVIDNESTDGAVEFIKKNFPKLGLFQNPNRIMCSFNDIVAKIDEDIVILLNNDLKVAPDFVDPLIGHFENDPEMFLVCPHNWDYEGKCTIGGVCRIWMSYGLLKIDSVMKKDEGPLKKAQITFGAGSAAAIDRKKFMELEGFDEVYLPGTMEDVDLCFQAWQRGYKCIYEPHSQIYHKGQMSFHKRFGARKTLAMNARNVYIFMWANLHSPVLWAEHVLFLLPRFVWAVFRNQTYWITGFFLALKRWSKIKFMRERRIRRGAKLYENEILGLFMMQKLKLREESV